MRRWQALLAASLVIGSVAGLGGGAGAAPLGSRMALMRAAAAAPPGSRMALMRAAAREFRVPVSVLLAVSYVETRWQRTGSAPSIDGGYGVMNLTALGEAARLLRVAARTLTANERQNIRGAAAVLAQDARKLNHGAPPPSLGGWYGAVAEYSGARTSAAATFADDVFAVLGRGASLRTSDGQAMVLPPTPGIHPDRAQLGRLGLAAAAPASRRVDCPRGLKCRFVPAGYAKDGRKPWDYGNYAVAARPDHVRSSAGQTVTMPIRYIIIHDAEGSYAGTIGVFQNPRSQVSANYVIRSSDGAVTEMVRPRDVSWGAANWYVNMHAVNIENEGFAAQGRTWYTQAEYRSDAALVRYLARRYGIPLDRQHILGHEDVPGETTYGTAAQHWDPGPFWNWNHFMALVQRVGDRAEQARGGSSIRGNHHLVTIEPTFSGNEPTVTDCSSGCVTLPRQPANFVYLHTGPGAGYPLLPDPILHPGASSGTTVDSDWGDKATIGETFVFAAEHGNWTGIWYAGRKAWFYNPHGSHQRARYRGGEVIAPNAGRKWIPVYGVAYPEESAYPHKVPAIEVRRLAYKIRAGQAYPVVGPVPTDYYYAPTVHPSPYDHTVIIGTTAYYQISFNHRKFFVRSSDVTVRHLA